MKNTRKSAKLHSPRKAQIRFAGNRERFLTQLRDKTTFDGRRTMNAKLSELFQASGTAMAEPVWSQAQALYVTKGVAAVKQLLA
jgi:hypothetical protein